MKIKKIQKFFHKYLFLILFALFLIWLTFFDPNSLITQIKLSNQEKQMREQAEWYRQEINRYKTQLNEIMYNPEVTEKFVREQYLMKKPNEEIFLIARPAQ
ncbi:MAG TPA: septum formation initiator [Bacteroidales bacterium]|jgi:cell division protein FtsB|nr:septum formation initiator [Bacteroidales bacterium]HAW57900.1 septum formation initiator [Bacteroidales bacterium]HQN98964.1 septum formation initiator family protein [Bacteroidales bacterium]HQQ03036.1 septum formation initiator family protein [Bacteroidales bacterium]